MYSILTAKLLGNTQGSMGYQVTTKETMHSRSYSNTNYLTSTQILPTGAPKHKDTDDDNS